MNVVDPIVKVEPDDAPDSFVPPDAPARFWKVVLAPFVFCVNETFFAVPVTEEVKLNLWKPFPKSDITTVSKSVLSLIDLDKALWKLVVDPVPIPLEISIVKVVPSIVIESPFSAPDSSVPDIPEF